MDTLSNPEIKTTEQTFLNHEISSSEKLPPNKKDLKRIILIGFFGLIIVLLGIVAFFFYVRFLIKTNTPEQKNINKLLEKHPTVQPKVTIEPGYANVITDGTGEMTFKFPIGAFGNLKGNIQLWPGRHGHDFAQTYRFVMDSLLVIGDIKQPVDFEFLKPISIIAQYGEQLPYIKHLDQSKLTFLYTKDTGDGVNGHWVTLPTQLDLSHYTVSTTGTHTGNYVLVAPLLCPVDTSEFDDNYDSSIRIGEFYTSNYDGNGGPSKISGIPFSQKIPRVFDIKQDEDWFRFEAKKGKTYILETSDLASGVKPLIIIYDTDGVTQLASNPLGLEWTPEDKYFQYGNAKTFFINVSAQLDSAIGCDAKFNFTLSEK